MNDIDKGSLMHAIEFNTRPLRRKYRLKLPDALICATALAINAVFVTNDKELKKVKELQFG